MRELLAVLISNIAWVFQLVLLASVILSWVVMVQRPRWMYHPLVRWVEDTAFLILRPFRQLLAAFGLGRLPLDISPILALFAIQIIRDGLIWIVWRLFP
jgi:YggT family protein